MPIRNVALICVLILSGRCMFGQETLSVRRFPGPREVESYGYVARCGDGVAFVGRSGVHLLDTLSNEWREVYISPKGTLIFTSAEEQDGSVVFLDTKRTLRRCRPDGRIDSVATVSASAESYTMSSGGGDLVICGFDRLLSTIITVRINSDGVDDVEKLTLPMGNLAVRTLEYADRCSTFVLGVVGSASGQSTQKVYRRFTLGDGRWIEIDENQEAPRSFVDRNNDRTCMLVGDSLYTTTSCPPSQSEEFVAGVVPRTLLAPITDSTIAMYTQVIPANEEPKIFIVNATSSRVVDTIVYAKQHAGVNVTGVGDLLYVNCEGRILVYRGRTLVRTVLWPTVESSTAYRYGISAGEQVLLHGGPGSPALLNTRTSTLTPVFALRNGDTARITAIDQGVSYSGVTYLWYEDRLFISRTVQPSSTYYDVVSSPRRIMHVRPIDNGDALVAVAIPDRDSTTPYWYRYSRTTGLLTPFPDTWPRAVHGLEPIASMYDPQSAIITVGTRTEWYDNRTDTSVYPIYGVLRRTEASTEWTMANEGLGVSLRCFDLQHDNQGRLFMLSTYSDGTTNMPRANFYVSTNIGASWHIAPQPLPIDLGKKYSLSVTSSGVFLHDQSCYRVVNGGEGFTPVLFSIDQLGTIYRILPGVDSTTLVMITSTGVYEVDAKTTSVGGDDEPLVSASINGTALTIRAESLGDNHHARIIDVSGQSVYAGNLQQTSLGVFTAALQTELPTGVYFVVVGTRVLKMVYVKT